MCGWRIFEKLYGKALRVVGSARLIVLDCKSTITIRKETCPILGLEFLCDRTCISR
jgi:hypothetical protein